MINLNPTFPSSDAYSCLPSQVFSPRYLEPESSLSSQQKFTRTYSKPNEYPPPTTIELLYTDSKITIPSMHRSSNCTVPFVSLADKKVCIPVLSHHVCSRITAFWKQKRVVHSSNTASSEYAAW